MATINVAYSATTTMSVTNLQSLASSATAGWQSDLVDNRTTLALDYEIAISLSTAATAVANDRGVYLWACPAYHDGTAWRMSDQGTITLPTGTQGTTTIASPHNLRLAGFLNYTSTASTLRSTVMLSDAVGKNIPDGFSLIVVNFSGAALGTGCTLAYKAITQTVA